MEQSIQLFNYGTYSLRVINKDGTIWFVAKDVADILDFNDATHAVRGLDDDEKGLQKVETPGGLQDMTVISESGLYTLVLRSNKPEAAPFRRWVTHEVLPQIRKTGSYSVKQSSEDLACKRSELDVERAKILQHMIDAPAVPLSPEALAVIQHELFKIVTGNECPRMLPEITSKLYSATEIGEMFGVSAKKIGKVAKEYGLKSPEGKQSNFGVWVLSKSKYSAHQCPTFMYNSDALSWFKKHSEQLG